jgi:hypothetical protein
VSLTFSKLAGTLGFRRIGARILARLDRFYISEKGLSRDMIDEYRIRGDSGISDHLPVSFRICLKKERRQSCCYKMNSTWLADPAMKAEISKLWKAFPEGTHFLVKL